MSSERKFAFLFYPGEYLRDTQCLNTNAQVAYDRIMCEHMRNICITHEQLVFFTKRLNEDERGELLLVLDKVDGGYQIPWVAESITRYNSFAESRRQNRLGKTKEHMNNTSQSYGEHMVSVNENVKENRKGKESEKEKKGATKKQTEHQEIAARVIAHNNLAAGRNFDTNNREYVRLITKLLNMGHTESQMLDVVDMKAAEWMGTEFEKRVCPATLFAAENFNRYLDDVAFAKERNLTASQIKGPKRNGNENLAAEVAESLRRKFATA